jgi:hypothetical protein
MKPTISYVVGFIMWLCAAILLMVCVYVLMIGA